MGLVFQLPTVVFFLARVGVVTPRFLVKNIKYAVLVIFIIAAIITPTADPVTQALVAGPMFALYLVSIAIAWIFQKRPARETAVDSLSA
jgi:sec-independent protein translocase protein TatC